MIKLNGWDKYDLYLEIYTDGACSTNGDWSGGYGMVVMDNNEIVHAERKAISETTNNREELKAMIAALKYVEKLYDNFSCTLDLLKIYKTHFMLFVKWIDTFIDKLKSTIDMMPLIIRYICKIISEQLKKKFFNCTYIEINKYITKFFFETIIGKIIQHPMYNNIISPLQVKDKMQSNLSSFFCEI